MKLFSTSALIFATTSALTSLEVNTGLGSTVLEELTRANDRYRRAPTKKQMKRNRNNQADKTDGYRAVESDLAKPHFRSIIRRHGAQAIVNARALNKREQFVMSKILQQKGKLTGRQLLWKIDNMHVDEDELDAFVQRQAAIMAKARNEVARNYALYGVDIDNVHEDDVQETQDEPDEAVAVADEPTTTQKPAPTEPVVTEAPAPAQQPTGMPKFYEPPSMNRHPNAHYPKEAFGSMTFKHPNANYPAHAFVKVQQHAPPTAFLKSALSGRGLPTGATRRNSPISNRFGNADPTAYKMAHLNAMKKEARAWKDALVAQTQKYNELVDMIQAAKMALDADRQANEMLARASRPVQAQQLNKRQQLLNQKNEMMLQQILNKAREATQAKERFDEMNEKNDSLLAQMASKRDELDEEEEASVDMTAPIQTPPLNAMSFSTQYKVAIWLKDHEGITYDQYNAIDDVIEDPSMDELTNYYYSQQKVLRGDKLDGGITWMLKLKDSLWKGLEADPVAPTVHHEEANNRNDNMLAQVSAEQAEQEKNKPKQLWIPPLSSMDFMVQYKVAMWLKDHDELTLEQLNNIESAIPTPTLTQITNYYYAQQKVLRRERLEKENAWMKKLRKTLWKGLKPDPIPQQQ
jgi:hypothetical protein